MARIEKATCRSEHQRHVLDVIEYQGRRWLVGIEREGEGQSAQTPTRLICLETLVFQEHQDPTIRYSISFPIPMSVLDGTGQSSLYSEYEIVDLQP